MVPTYAFLITILGAIIWGLIKTAAAGGHPIPVVAPPAPLAPR